VKDVPTVGRGVEHDDLGRLEGPFQPKPFYDSIIILISTSERKKR